MVNLTRLIVYRFEDQVFSQISNLNRNNDLRHPIKDEKTLIKLDNLFKEVEELAKLCKKSEVDPLAKIYLEEMQVAIIQFRHGDITLFDFMKIAEKTKENLMELIK